MEELRIKRLMCEEREYRHKQVQLNEVRYESISAKSTVKGTSPLPRVPAAYTHSTHMRTFLFCIITLYYYLCVMHQLHCLQLPARPGIVTAMSLLRYIKVISKPSDASSSSSGSHAEGSSTNHDEQCHGARDDDSAEDSGPSPLKSQNG